MKSAYDARSAVAHGGTPKPDDMKVRGQRVSLEELAKTAKSVITAGCKAALQKRPPVEAGRLIGTHWALRDSNAANCLRMAALPPRSCLAGVII